MNKKSIPNQPKGNLDGFESHGDSGAENRNDYEERINLLPGDEKELAQETSRFADLCQYFERNHMDVPSQFVDQLGMAPPQPIDLRIRSMRNLNQRLMEYLSNVSKDSGFRQ